MVECVGDEDTDGAGTMLLRMSSMAEDDPVERLEVDVMSVAVEGKRGALPPLLLAA